MKILITGVAGFIGSRLAEALLSHGHEVSGIDNLSTGRRDNVPREVDFTQEDIAREGLIGWGGYDVIYHAAASYKDRDNWERDARTNVLGTINVVRAAQKAHAKLVYFQTSLCYGPTSGLIRTSAPLDPHGSYAVSKTAAESYIRDSGVEYVSLRLANMYGPRNLSGPVPTFYQRLSEGRPCTIVDARRDYVFVDDLVWVAVKAATQGQGVYHVSSGADYSIAELYLSVAAAMGKEVTPPTLQARGPDDVATLLLDPSETAKEFSWTARTPLHDGIRRAVDWYDTHPVTEVYTHLAMKG
jgi:UDP-glucose 4-epimerase